MNVTVAVTGASGAVLAQQLLHALEADQRVTAVDFVVSESALRVIAEELHLSGRNELVEKLLGGPPKKTHQHAEQDIAASIASGSYPSAGMIVLPCSMGTLAGIANGMAGESDRTGRGCLSEGAAAAAALRARDAVQQDSPAQHAACSGCRSDDLSRDPGLLQRASRPRRTWCAVLWTACSRTSGFPSRARMSGSPAPRSSDSQAVVISTQGSRVVHILHRHVLHVLSADIV